MKIEFIHWNYLTITTTCCTSFYSKSWSLRWLTKAGNNLGSETERIPIITTEHIWNFVSVQSFKPKIKRKQWRNTTAYCKEKFISSILNILMHKRKQELKSWLWHCRHLTGDQFPELLTKKQQKKCGSFQDCKFWISLLEKFESLSRLYCSFHLSLQRSARKTYQISNIALYEFSCLT